MQNEYELWIEEVLARMREGRAPATARPRSPKYGPNCPDMTDLINVALQRAAAEVVQRVQEHSRLCDYCTASLKAYRNVCRDVKVAEPKVEESQWQEIADPSEPVEYEISASKDTGFDLINPPKDDPESLRKWIGKELVAQLAAHPLLALCNRALVDAAYEQRCRAERLDGGCPEAGRLSTEERRSFFEAAADAVRRLLRERAEQEQRGASAPTASLAKITEVSPGGDVEEVASSFVLAKRIPHFVLARDRGFEALAEAFPPAALAYGLSRYAGRTDAEVAELLGWSPEIAAKKLAMAALTVNSYKESLHVSARE